MMRIIRKWVYRLGFRPALGSIFHSPSWISTDVYESFKRSFDEASRRTDKPVIYGLHEDGSHCTNYVCSLRHITAEELQELREEGLLKTMVDLKPEVENELLQTDQQASLESLTFPQKAVALVYGYVKTNLEKTDTHFAFGEDDVYLVWFCKTLQNWKALISTTLPDGMYYEVTYNGDKRETYIDAYKKFNNICVPD
jgi:hypothetical protein